jgi:flagellar capping protein FliD
LQIILHVDRDNINKHVIDARDKEIVDLIKRIKDQEEEAKKQREKLKEMQHKLDDRSTQLDEYEAMEEYVKMV